MEDRHWLSEQVLRFEGENRDLDLATEQGVMIRFMAEEGRLRMFVEIGEGTGIKHLEASWWLISEWRERLLRFQGPWRRGGQGEFYQHLLDLHVRRRKSYQAIADMLNKKLADLLTDYAGFLAEWRAAKRKIKTKGDYWRFVLEAKHRDFSLRDADELLKDTRPSMSEHDRHDCLRLGLEEIEAGCPPFPANMEPIIRDDVIARIRAWRKRLAECAQGEEP